MYGGKQTRWKNGFRETGERSISGCDVGGDEKEEEKEKEEIVIVTVQRDVKIEQRGNN